MKQYCSYCGKLLEDNQNFCDACGRPVVNGAPGSASQHADNSGKYINRMVKQPDGQYVNQKILKQPNQYENVSGQQSYVEPGTRQQQVNSQTPIVQQKQTSSGAATGIAGMALWLKILLAVVIVAALGIGIFAIVKATAVHTPEQTIEQLETAINKGDLTEVLSCVDSNTSNQLKGMAALADGFLGESSADIMNGLFSLGLAGSNMHIDMTVLNTEYLDDTHAVVTLEITISSTEGSETDSGDFNMVKEGGEWKVDASELMGSMW